MAHPVQQTHLNKLRKDKFTLLLTLPNILKGIETRTVREDKYINLDSLQFSVYNVNIPRITVPEKQLHFGQQNYNISSYDRPAYSPITVNFEVDNEFKNYWVLWKWLQLLNDPTNATFAGKNIFPNGPPDEIPEILYNYVTTLSVLSKDEYNNDVAKFLFKYAFITELGEMEYNYRDPSQLSCQFTFVFNQMDMELLGDGTERT